jgi:hypothetical protein
LFEVVCAKASDADPLAVSAAALALRLEAKLAPRSDASAAALGSTVVVVATVERELPNRRSLMLGPDDEAAGRAEDGAAVTCWMTTVICRFSEPRSILGDRQARTAPPWALTEVVVTAVVPAAAGAVVVMVTGAAACPVTVRTTVWNAAVSLATGVEVVSSQ